jgi:hypothetical protein
MPYADPEKAKAQSRVRGRAWYAANRERARKRGRQYDAEHKSETAERGKRWFSDSNNRDRKISSEAQRLYGITLEDKKQMYDEQQGICPVCSFPLPEDFRSACVDHDHRTDRVRQLLHRKCNMLVGVEENQPGTCDAIKSYLEKHNAVQE